jgi:hypothetical protein
MRSFGLALALAALIGAVSLDTAEAMPLGAAKSLSTVAGTDGSKVDVAYYAGRCARVFSRRLGWHRVCAARVYRPGYAYGYGYGYPYPYYGYGYPGGYYGPYVGFGYYGGWYGRGYYGGRYGRYYGGRGWHGGGGRVIVHGGHGGRR